jgi:hypothetical protein
MDKIIVSGSFVLYRLMKFNITCIYFFVIPAILYAQEVIPDNKTSGIPETLPKEIKFRVECFLGVSVIISYNENEDSHVCNAAKFHLYANNEKLLNINGNYDANLNNGDNDEILLNGGIGMIKELLNLEYPNVGGSRNERFVINIDNAMNIFKDGVERVTLFLECSTPDDSDRGHGYGKCHSNVPVVKILKTEINKGEVVLYHKQPNVVGVKSSTGKDRVALITINSCGVLINEGI